MRTISITWKFSMTCIALFIALAITSCTDENDADSAQVELLSFGPSGVQPGEQIRFIGNNLNEVTDIELTGVSVSQASFVSQTSEEIVIVVPMEAEEGFIVIKSPQGDITSKTKLSFEVPVTIASVTTKARPGSTITITGDYLNWITQVQFSKDIIVKEFVSQSLHELVVTVPEEAQTGPLVFSTGGTKPLTIETEEDLVVTLPSVSSLSPNPVERGGNLTITGTDLDLVSGVLFKGLTEPVTAFVSKTATELVVTVPVTANKGKITLVAKSQIEIESEEVLTFVGDLPDLAPLPYAFYVDALQNNWQNWGWGSTSDFSSTDNVRDGNSSIKLNYTGNYGALYFGNGSASTASYTRLTFSVFGTTGTDGKKINILLNWGSPYVVTLQEGKWVEFTINLSDLGNPATITDLVFQNQDWIGIVYVDHVGLR